MRRLLRVLLVLLMLFAAIGGAAAWLALTESGLRVAVTWLFGPGVQVRDLSGRAIGPMRLRDLQVDLGSAIIRADEVLLDWDPMQWLQGRIHLRPLRIESLEVELTESEAAPRGEPLVLDRAIVVPELQVRGIVMRSGDDRWEAREARLSLVAAGRSLRLDELILEGSNLQARGAGTVGLNPEDALDFGLSWQVRRDDGTELGGQTRFRGSWERVAFAHEGRAPFQWEAAGELWPLVEQPRWDVSVRIARFQPSQINADWPDTPVAAELQFRGEGAFARTDARIDLPEYSDRTIILGGAFSPDGQRIRLDQMALSLEGLAARVVVDGTMVLERTVGFDLRGRWVDVEVETDAGPWGSPRGDFELIGDPEAYGGSFSAQVAGRTAVLGAIEARLAGDLAGDATGLRVSSLELRSAPLNAAGRVTVNWADEPRLEAEVTGGPLDPGVVDPRLTGAIAFDAAAVVRWPEAGASYVIDLQAVSGTLNGQPVSGSANIRSLPGGGGQVDAGFAVGDNRFQARGTVAERLALSWELDARALAQVIPEASGRLQGRGRVQGNPAAPAVELQAQGADLGWRDLAVGTLDIGARFDAAADTIEQARLEARSVSWRGVALKRLSGQATGAVAGHRFVIEAVNEQGSARLQGRGGYGEHRWLGEITGGHSEIDRLGRWRLVDAFDLEVSGSAAGFDRACLAEGPSRLCARASWSEADGWKAEATLQAVALERLSPWLPTGIDYRGTVSGEVDLSGPPQVAWQGRGRARAIDVSLSRPGREAALTRVSEATLDFNADPAMLRISLALDLEGEGRLEARLQADREDAEGALQGSVRGRLNELDFLALLYPKLLEVEGELRLDVAVGGTLASPRYSGDITLIGGQATLLELGITVEDIAIELAGDAAGVRIAASGRSGEGRIEVAGRVDWSAKDLKGRITLAGERFRMADISGIRVDASPDLLIEIAGRDLDLTGAIHVDEARIAPVGLDTTGRVSASPDEVIIGTGPEEPERWRVASQVTVTLGDITIDAYGLRSELEGSLQIADLPGQVATASGMLTIEKGWYSAYGQNLDIDRGRLTYRGGPVDNPELDVRAVRYLESYIVGVNVRGTLQNPRIEVFSDPPRPRQYALYLLLLGEAPVELGRAGESLGYGSPSAQFESSVGLGSAGASAGLGTFLAPDFYVSYLESLSLRYRINRKWTVEAERGVESSVGIIYSIR